MSNRPSGIGLRIWLRRSVIRGFTLIEVLLVIAIIGVLLSMLLPSMQAAKDVARDVRCAASMRGTIQSVALYNNIYPKTGLQSLSNNCTYWNQGWAGGAAGAHWNDSTYGSNGHGWNEGRAFWPYWREHLALEGLAGILDSTGTGLTNSSGLGCNAKDYSSLQFYRSSNTTASNYASGSFVDFETNPAARSYASNPAYFWFGPGSYDTGRTSAYAANVTMPTYYPWTSVDSNSMTYDRRGPLFQCPQVQLSYNNSIKIYEVPHRPQWGTYSSATPGMWPAGMAYASNVGMTDGSVKFYINQNGGYINPVQ